MAEMYRTIVADPPWPQKGGGSLKGREGFLENDNDAEYEHGNGQTPVVALRNLASALRAAAPAEAREEA